MGYYHETQSAIRSRWATLVEAALNIPTKYPNQPNFIPPLVDVWAEYAMEEVGAEQADLGDPEGNLVRHPGFVNVNLYFKQGGTERSPEKYLDDIVPLFRMLTVTTTSGYGIVFNVPRRTTVGNYEQWYVINLTMPFTSDEVT